VLEASIEMGLHAQRDDDRIVVTVNMGVHSVQALEDLLQARTEGFGEGDADAGGEDGFVIDGGLHPGHEVLDVFGGGHLGGLFVVVVVLPEVFESGVWFVSGLLRGCYEVCAYSSVAFISGQLCGLQNSVIEPYSRLIWL
jgi:hypothetical protein